MAASNRNSKPTLSDRLKNMRFMKQHQESQLRHQFQLQQQKRMKEAHWSVKESHEDEKEQRKEKKEEPSFSMPEVVFDMSVCNEDEYVGEDCVMGRRVFGMEKEKEEKIDIQEEKKEKEKTTGKRFGFRKLNVVGGIAKKKGMERIKRSKLRKQNR